MDRIVVNDQFQSPIGTNKTLSPGKSSIVYVMFQSPVGTNKTKMRMEGSI